jgi:hypothetical protein
VRIGILQPGYLPWLGFFEQLAKTDVFVLYDDVQYDKHGWRNRNRIKTAAGPRWLTVPVITRQHTLIKDVAIDGGKDWARKHVLSLRQNYSKAPHFAKHFPAYDEALGRPWKLLADLDEHLIKVMAGQLGLDASRVVRSSSVGVHGGRDERLVALCRHFGAKVFYEGAAGKDYIDETLFLDHGVRVEYQDYRHPEYKQLFGPFVSHLSAVDLLFNHGPKSLAILTGGA